MTSSEKPSIPSATHYPESELRGHTTRSLAKAIFKAEVPEAFIKTLPAQSIYMVLKTNGLESSGDLLDMISREQYGLLLDFDLWENDVLSEERFWQWIAQTDEQEDLFALEKLVNCIDLKLIALIIGKYVQTIIYDEPADQPPGPQFYTPDKGASWISINIESTDQQRLLGKLLAFIFESKPELYYQLISIPTVSTNSMLEEESYQERNKRLMGEGIPDHELAYRVNAPLSAEQFLAEYRVAVAKIEIQDVKAIEPLLYERGVIEPLSGLFKEISSGRTAEREDFEAELTLITNAAIVVHKTDFAEHEQVLTLIEQVKGALNIGLERALAITKDSPIELYRRIGLQKLYQFGLGELKSVRVVAMRISEDQLRAASSDNEAFSIVAGARERFPRIPNFFRGDGSFEQVEGKLTAGYRAFELHQEIQLVLNYINERFPQTKPS